MSEIGHNSGAIAADEIRLLLERVERLQEEKKGITDDIRDVFAEAKGRGYDVKTMRYALAQRKMTKDERDNQRAMQETYLAALGLL